MAADADGVFGRWKPKWEIPIESKEGKNGCRKFPGRREKGHQRGG